MKSSLIETPIGTLLAVGDEEKLYLLEFTENRDISCVRTRVHDLIEKELSLYFAGKLQHFTTPLAFSGTPFQVSVWQELQKIPYGKTCSYMQLAAAVGRPTSYRAAANANGRNKFVIVIPCHRVISADGTLGGYSSGLHRKAWLLEHEAEIIQESPLSRDF